MVCWMPKPGRFFSRWFWNTETDMKPLFSILTILFFFGTVGAQKQIIFQRPKTIDQNQSDRNDEGLQSFKSVWFDCAEIGFKPIRQKINSQNCLPKECWCQSTILIIKVSELRLLRSESTEGWYWFRDLTKPMCLLKFSESKDCFWFKRMAARTRRRFVIWRKRSGDETFSVDVSYQNLKGETITETIKGFTAVIFQHERDHLDGILLTDRIKEQKEMKFEPVPDESNLYELKSDH